MNVEIVDGRERATAPEPRDAGYRPAPPAPKVLPSDPDPQPASEPAPEPARTRRRVTED
jgi:hypothetical protein